MSKEGNKTYWFRAKKYGWGWGLPLTWQGWLSFAVFVAIWFVALLTLLVIPEGSTSVPTKNITIFAIVIFLDVCGLVYLSFKHGESPKWRWGKKKK